MVRLQLLFVVEHAVEVFDLVRLVQVCVAGTFAPEDGERRAKPTMHRVYSRMHDLHAALQWVVDSKRLHCQTESRLERKRPSGASMYDAATWQANFLDVLKCAAQKTWKYVGKHMELAKQALVLDPT